MSGAFWCVAAVTGALMLAVSLLVPDTITQEEYVHLLWGAALGLGIVGTIDIFRGIGK